MSRTYRGNKGPGFEYWKSRWNKECSGGQPGRFTKSKTHRYERRISKSETEEIGDNLRQNEDVMDWDYGY